jgi:hypothetical protein
VKRSQVVFAPKGQPETKPVTMGRMQFPFIPKISCVSGVSGRFKISAKPLIHMMFVIIIKGKSEGIALLNHRSKPFFAPLNVSVGNISIIRLKISADNVIM